MRRRLSRWLLPTFAGPVLSALLLVTLRELWTGLSLFAVVRWLTFAALAGATAVLLGGVLVLVDWVLLLFKRRLPPTGAAAWLSGAAASPLAYGLWLLLRPPLLSTPLVHALALAGALFGAALGVRLAASPRPGRGGPFRFS
jgi:hypothetical protein